MQSYYDTLLLRLGRKEDTVCPRITFFCFGGVAVEGHRGLLSYSDEKIVFFIGKKQMEIVGRKLKITEVSATELLVCGEVDRVGAVHEDRN